MDLVYDIVADSAGNEAGTSGELTVDVYEGDEAKVTLGTRMDQPEVDSPRALEYLQTLLGKIPSQLNGSESLVQRAVQVVGHLLN